MVFQFGLTDAKNIKFAPFSKSLFFATQQNYNNFMMSFKWHGVVGKFFNPTRKIPLA